jgi:CRISPR type IV-associated protein Csf1
MMLRLSQIFTNHVGISEYTEFGTCAICGAGSIGLPLKKAVSAKFNDFQYMRFKTDFTCGVCHKCLSGGGLDGKALRNYHTIANLEQIIFLEKSQIHDYIISPLDPPFIFLVSFSKKKHIFLHAKINFEKNPIYIATDKQDIILDIGEYAHLFGACKVLYDVGFSKTEMQTGLYKKLSLIDEVSNFWDHDLLISKYRNRFILQFTLYTISKKEEKEIEDDQD